VASGDFLDVSLSELLGGYIAIEQSKTDAEIRRYEYETVSQAAVLNASESDSFSESVGGGSYEPSSYLSQVPKGLFYGSVVLLGVGVGLMAFRK